MLPSAGYGLPSDTERRPCTVADVDADAQSLWVPKMDRPYLKNLSISS
jgi:hypothetical protein